MTGFEDFAKLGGLRKLKISCKGGPGPLVLSSW
jgi:hypothetical protein